MIAAERIQMVGRFYTGQVSPHSLTQLDSISPCKEQSEGKNTPKQQPKEAELHELWKAWQQKNLMMMMMMMSRSPALYVWFQAGDMQPNISNDLKPKWLTRYIAKTKDLSLLLVVFSVGTNSSRIINDGTYRQHIMLLSLMRMIFWAKNSTKKKNRPCPPPPSQVQNFNFLSYRCCWLKLWSSNETLSLFYSEKPLLAVCLFVSQSKHLHWRCILYVPHQMVSM